jgi:dCMP deaminase
MAAQIDFDQYFLKIAKAVSKRSTCLGRHVGAVLVQENRIVSTGYNGTPENVRNCNDHGCPRCDPDVKVHSRIRDGQAYDICLCVHAEENAMLSAARFGSSLDHAVLYTTHQPCFICLRHLIQVGASRVVYSKPWQHPAKYEWLNEAYASLTHALPLTHVRTIPQLPRRTQRAA